MKKIIKKKFPYIVIAVILLQTLFYKFTAHPESVALFTQVNLFGLGEAFGRIFVGVLEFLVSIGIFISKTRKISLIGVIGLMFGAVYFHITKIGFAANNLPLFISGLVVLFTAVYLLRKK